MGGGDAGGCDCDNCQYVEIVNCTFESISGGMDSGGMGDGGNGGDGFGIYLNGCFNVLVTGNGISVISGADGGDSYGSGGNGGDAIGIYLKNCSVVTVDGNRISNLRGGSRGYGDWFDGSDGIPRPLVCFNSSPTIINNEFKSEGIYVYIDSTSQPIIGGAPGNGNVFIKNEGYVIYNDSPYDIDATWNFWETGPDMIDSLIFGYYDDPTKGIVHYDHYTDVEERESRQQFTLSSNLVHDVLYVSFPYDSPASLEFFDAAGRRVHSEVLSGSKTEVDVSSFPRGVYFVIAQIGERQVTKKVVIR